MKNTGTRFQSREEYKKSLIGQQFGLLTITGIAEQYDTDRGLFVKVKCRCGTEKVLRLNSLRSGNTRSCGNCGYKREVLSKLFLKDLTGQRFGRLTAIRRTSIKRGINGGYCYECKCDCGRTAYVPAHRLSTGNVKSCGKCSYHTEMTTAAHRKYHSAAERRLVSIYYGMMQRCYNTKNKSYPRYGARGVYVCDEWRNNPVAFVRWGIETGYKPDVGLSIDRINEDPKYKKEQNGPYAPWNCRWTDAYGQTNHLRTNHVVTVGGRTMTLAQWARYLGIAKTKLENQVQYERLQNEPRDSRLCRYIGKKLLIKEGVDKVILGSFYLKKNVQLQTQREENEMFTLMQESEAPQMSMSVNFNTDSMFDLLTGDVRRGFDGKWLINGGLGPSVCGGLGRSGMFKSTFATSLAMRVSALYGSQMAIFDSEDAISRGRERILRMAGEYRDRVNDEYVLLFDAKNECDLESIRERIYDLGEKKKAAGEKAKLTTPFVGPDGKRVKVLFPSVVIIDSYTECFSREEELFISEKGIDDSKAKTMFMLDANKKTVVLRNLNRYAAQYGIQLIVTAHYGQKLNLDSYLPSPKMLQYGSQNEAPKGVGGKFLFLTSPQFLINSCTKMQDDAKECRYKLNGRTSPTDLSEITILMQRCKNNLAGLTHPFVVSQDNGLLTAATDYNYLRSIGKGFSMQGNNVTHQSMFLPEVSMTRNTFRGICETDHRLIRALQLGAQLCYIQNNWSSAGWEFPMNVEPKALVEILLSDKDKMSKDRILNSRSYWLPDELTTKETSEYMSIFDILEFCSKASVKK